MIKKLRKVGNSNAVLLDKPVMELVGIEEGSAVQVTVDSGNIIITPVSPQSVSQEKFDECLNKVVASRAKVLKKLAQ